LSPKVCKKKKVLEVYQPDSSDLLDRSCDHVLLVAVAEAGVVLPAADGVGVATVVALVLTPAFLYHDATVIVALVALVLVVLTIV
jgi:hypothetical protein